MNCWEFKICGREAGGAKECESGVCPAYPDKGTQCARVTGTFCAGGMRTSFPMKLSMCLKCNFYTSKHYIGLLEGIRKDARLSGSKNNIRRPELPGSNT